VIRAVSNYAVCRALRQQVFVEEQGVSQEDEWDDLDDDAVHLLLTVGGTDIGTARLLTKGSTGKIGRICVLAQYRGGGHGKALVEAGVAHFMAQDAITAVVLSAQDHAIGFYEKLGFTATGPFYDDAGIPHRDMWRHLPPR